MTFIKFILSLFTITLINGLKAQANPNVNLKFDIDTVDFGTVGDNDTVIYDFWFTNIGSEKLIIKQAHPACGCTKPTISKDSVGPGERGFIHVEFHSNGFGGKEVLKEIIVINNGPERYARFKAKVVNKQFLEDLNNYKNPPVQNKKKKKRKKIK